MECFILESEIICKCFHICICVHGIEIYVCVCVYLCISVHSCICVCAHVYVCVCTFEHEHMLSKSIHTHKTLGHACRSQRTTSHMVLTFFEKGCHFIGCCICQGKWPTSSQRFPWVCFPSPLRSSEITAVCYHIRLYVVSGELNSCPHIYAAVIFTHCGFSSTLSHPWVGTRPLLL